ncbi:MAG: PilZ domain-containing protein [Candidatus Omnitrophica bacterium]|nr:PilZ domain-containing protein [Candidatus Omnitrophota bacterium]
MQTPGLQSKKNRPIRFDVQLPLTYNSYGKIQQDNEKKGLTIDISTGGVLFETESKPELGNICKLKVILSEKEIITAIGKTIKIDEINSSGNKIYKVRVKFTQISNTDIDKICIWYSQNKLMAERRRSKRFKGKEVHLKYRKKQLLKWGKRQNVQISNISAKGILCNMKEDIKVNEMVLIELYSPAYEKPLISIGKIIRTKKKEKEFINEVAIELFDLKEEDIKKLEELKFLETSLDKPQT